MRGKDKRELSCHSSPLLVTSGSEWERQGRELCLKLPEMRESVLRPRRYVHCLGKNSHGQSGQLTIIENAHEESGGKMRKKTLMHSLCGGN